MPECMLKYAKGQDKIKECYRDRYTRTTTECGSSIPGAAAHSDRGMNRPFTTPISPEIPATAQLPSLPLRGVGHDKPLATHFPTFGIIDKHCSLCALVGRNSAGSHSLE